VDPQSRFFILGEDWKGVHVAFHLHWSRHHTIWIAVGVAGRTFAGGFGNDMDALVPSNTLEDEPKVEDRKDQVRRNTRHTSEGGCERTVEGNERKGWVRGVERTQG